MYTFESLIKLAAERHASDLHLSPGRVPSCRIDGVITGILPEKLTAQDTQEIADQILNETRRLTLEQNGEVDFACFDPAIGRFRLNIFRQRNSIALVARILNAEIPEPRMLGIPDSVVEVSHKKSGLILVTGPTGVGKTTTIASLLNQINLNYEKHIITLEDPIEYLHPHARSIVNQREVGADTRTFATGLFSALREDPDIIFIGEMRDLDTISSAITAAETGHLVLSTLHTPGSSSTIDRIIDVFPPHQQQQIRTQLADVLECVVSQRLLPCANAEGRVAAMEVMLTNSAIRNCIRENKSYQIPSVIQTHRAEGMQTMDTAIVNLYYSGKITRETAYSYANDKEQLKHILN